MTAGIGHNGAPIETPFDALKLHMDDLRMEAENWADGTPLETESQAQKVALLREQIKQAIKAADEARTVEKAPHDKAVKEIQGRYNVYIAPKTNSKPGLLTKADTALGNLLGAHMAKKEEAQRAEQARLQAQADKLAQEAVEARKAIEGSTDLASIDVAEEAIERAAAFQKDADKLAKAKVQVKGEGQQRAAGYRTRLVATLNEGGRKEALQHYMRTYPEDVQAFIQSMADKDARAGVRHIPGFTVTEERYVV